MASVNMPSVMDVSSMNSIAELKNAVAKMSKELSWLLENLDWGNINRLHIRLNDGATVTIMNDGITINNGEVDTFKADKEGNVVMTSAVVQSKEGYPKVVMDPQSDLFGAYQSETQNVTVGVYGSTLTSSPYVQWVGGPGQAYVSSMLDGVHNFIGTTPVRLAAGPGQNTFIDGQRIALSAQTYVDVPSWGSLRDNSTLQTAEQTFCKKGTQTSPSPPFNGGIPIGTVLKDINGVPYTWTGIPAHTHTQN